VHFEPIDLVRSSIIDIEVLFMIMISDCDLIRQLQQGNLEALGVLYDRHRHLVYRTALAITNDTEAAADILQEVFLRLHRFAERVDSERPLEPWLYRVTTNLAYTWVRQQHRWFKPFEEMVEKFSNARKQTPPLLFDLDEETQRVQKALASLPAHQRVVVALYYINDLPLQEIAQVLGIPEGTVKSRLHYGREALKQSLRLEAGEVLPELQYEFT
jgi:RNA polymerase sigma-70 factor (ECF subfamily)